MNKEFTLPISDSRFILSIVLEILAEILCLVILFSGFLSTPLGIRIIVSIGVLFGIKHTLTKMLRHKTLRINDVGITIGQTVKQKRQVEGIEWKSIKKIEIIMRKTYLIESSNPITILISHGDQWSSIDLQSLYTMGSTPQEINKKVISSLEYYCTINKIHLAKPK